MTVDFSLMNLHCMVYCSYLLSNWYTHFFHLTKKFSFQILILEPTRVLMPSYVTVNNSQDEQSVQIWNVCIKCLKNKSSCRQLHNWLFSADQIKTMTLYKRDERCIFFYVHLDDFQMYFPSETWRQRFYDMVMVLTADQEGMIKDLDTEDSSEPILFEYDRDEHEGKIILGRGKTIFFLKCHIM